MNSASEPTTSLSFSDVSNRDSKKRKKANNNSGIRQCFSALVDRKQVNVELDVLKLLIRKELDIDTEKTTVELQEMLPYLLIYHIKTWPGWEMSVEYFSGKIPFKTWFDKFYKDIVAKLNQNIHVHYKEVVAENEKLKNAVVCSKSIQTDDLNFKLKAPFAVKITANPEYLNTMLFTDNAQGDVILKQHKPLTWTEYPLVRKQIMSWPFAAIKFKSPMFEFYREIDLCTDRHIRLVGTPLPPAKTEFIDNIKVLNEDRAVYTVGYFKEMINTMLTNLAPILGIPLLITKYQDVFEEFLTDIEDINYRAKDQPAIASNTEISFNIGKRMYLRNKKLSKGHKERQYVIGYTEIVTPKVKVSCTVSPQSDIENYINYLKNFPMDTLSGTNNLPEITFSCTYCSVDVTTLTLLEQHFKTVHKMEQPMLCWKCKKSCPVLELAQFRWSHTCTSLNGGQ